MGKRLRWFVVVAFVMATGLMMMGRASAHDTTPSADSPITDAVIASGMPVDAPGKVLQLEQITIAPGAAIPTHVHPGAYAIYVASGTLDFTVVKGEAVLTKQGEKTGTTYGAGSTFQAQAGDSVFENGGVVHSAANSGTEGLLLYTAALLTANEPSLVPSNDEGTPTA